MRLTEREHDSLTECECGHYANEHSPSGCLATVDAGTGIGETEDQCVCSYSPTAINRHAVEAIKAAAYAAGGGALTLEALAGLLPPHHLGVPCEACNSRVGVACTTPAGTLCHAARAMRERRAWHVRHWLFLQGIDANEAKP